MDRTDKTPSRHTMTVMAFFRSLSARLFDPYRPELHYMRGPGPKWHEKHGTGAAPASPTVSIPAAA